MPIHTDVDVLIVGAGPTGLTTANILGQNGVKTLVIERNAATVAEPRAVSIDDESLRTMQAIGLVRRVTPRTLPGYGARYYSPGKREFARIKPTAREFGYPKRSAFRQPELEATLRDGLNRFPSVEIRFGHTLESFTQDADAVIATVRDAGGAEHTIRAKFLAACDGGRSGVRKAIGSTLVGSSFEERWLVFDMEGDPDDTPDSIAYCDHRRPAISLPGPEHRRRWEFLVHPHENADDFVRDDTIDALLAPYGGRRGAQVIRRIVYTFHARVADRWSDGRVFLLGDAAHLTPPYAGQGMNSGQRDAMNFAWKAAAVVAGRLGVGAMRSYESERRDHARALIQMAIQIGWVMVPRNWWHTYGQILFFKLAAAIPPLRDYLINMRFKPVPRFREGLLVPDGHTAKHTIVGRMLPQPTVTDEGGQERLLDDALGNGFALLALGLDPDEAFAAAEHPLWDRLGARRVALVTPGGANATKESPPPLRGRVREGGAPSDDGFPDGVKNSHDAPTRYPPPGLPLKGGGESERALHIITDRDGILAARLVRYRGEILLVRPDRYVAAAFSPHGAAVTAEEFEGLIA